MKRGASSFASFPRVGKRQPLLMSRKMSRFGPSEYLPSPPPFIADDYEDSFFNLGKIGYQMLF